MAVEYAQRRFTVDEYLRMAELGIIGEDERVELIDGAILTVPPSGDAHRGGINRLNDLLVRRFSGRAIVQPQLPVRISDYSLPEPDIALLRPDPWFYGRRSPIVADTFAFLEVSYSSLAFDRGTKLRVYARARVLDYWVIDVRNNRILVHGEPNDLGYATCRDVARGERLAFAAFPDDAFFAEEILPTVGEGIREDGGDDPLPTGEAPR